MISIYNEFSQDLSEYKVLILHDWKPSSRGHISFEVEKDIKPWDLVLKINEALQELQKHTEDTV